MVLYHHIPPIYGDFGDGGSYCFNHITFFSLVVPSIPPCFLISTLCPSVFASQESWAAAPVPTLRRVRQQRTVGMKPICSAAWKIWEDVRGYPLVNSQFCYVKSQFLMGKST